MDDFCVLLLVDDDEDDRALFKEAVRQVDLSITCQTAVDGLDALQLLANAKHLPHLIFLDLNMPRMGGIECLCALKRDQRLAHVPVFIYSTSRTQDDVEAVLKLGALDYFKKPVHFDEMTDLIGRVIDQCLPKKVRKITF